MPLVNGKALTRHELMRRVGRLDQVAGVRLVTLGDGIERGVRVFDSLALQAKCSCSRDSVDAMLRSFSQDDRDHMVENGAISVTCEFCSETYVFDPASVGDK